VVRWKYVVVAGSLGLLLPIVIAFLFGDREDPRWRSEMTAVNAMTTIHTAETQYYSQFGRYATSLAQLGPTGANLIDRHLASGEKGGFKFVLRQAQTGYALTVHPVAFGTSGIHTYYSDQSMSIHQHNGAEPATVGDPPLGEPAPTKPCRA
jgi:type IV pilus assembly protein PilA